MGFCKLEANEKTKCEPVSDYDKTKYMAEKLVKNYSVKHAFPTVIIRPVMVYGPGETKNKAKMFRLIQKGIFRIIGNGKNLVSLVYIDDLVKGIILASENKKAVGQVYILSDGEKHTMNKFIAIIAKAEGVKQPSYVPLWLAKITAYVFDFLSKITNVSFPLYKDRVNSLTISRSFDISKAKKELGYNPKINLKEGIKRTVKWYKKHGILN